MSAPELQRALELQGVEMAYGSTRVLKGIDLSVAAGGITAILGASGSGKTTLLRVIAGFERADRGSISLAGQLIESPQYHLAPERRGLGYVAQEGALFPHLDVARNVGFGLRRSARHGGRIDELLELVGLPGLARRFPHELSGGQQQRVALARALALEPAVVLLDEPFSSLDAALRVSVRADIARILRDAGTTVVLVTHDQDEALSMADQVAVLRDGRVAQVGSARDVYTNPIDPAMAVFVGDANLVKGRVDGPVAVTALGRLTVPTLSSPDAVVLVRPEQIAITAGRTDAGVTGVVVEQIYQGHDSIISVRPDHDCGAERLLVRVQGAATFAVGSPVTLTASGGSVAWPAAHALPAADPPVRASSIRES